MCIRDRLYIPPKFAHGFVVLSDEAEFVYKCTEFYHGEDEGGIMWNDPDIACLLYTSLHKLF